MAGSPVLWAGAVTLLYVPSACVSVCHYANRGTRDGSSSPLSGVGSRDTWMCSLNLCFLLWKVG